MTCLLVVGSRCMSTQAPGPSLWQFPISSFLLSFHQIPFHARLWVHSSVYWHLVAFSLRKGAIFAQSFSSDLRTTNLESHTSAHSPQDDTENTKHTQVALDSLPRICETLNGTIRYTFGSCFFYRTKSKLGSHRFSSTDYTATYNGWNRSKGFRRLQNVYRTCAIPQFTKYCNSYTFQHASSCC